MASAYDAAFASYTDARRRFQELKTARGYLPIVALTDGGGGSSSNVTSPASAASWLTKGSRTLGSQLPTEFIDPNNTHTCHQAPCSE